MGASSVSTKNGIAPIGILGILVAIATYYAGMRHGKQLEKDRQKHEIEMEKERRAHDISLEHDRRIHELSIKMADEYVQMVRRSIDGGTHALARLGLDQLGKLAKDYDLVKNERLNKYEIRQEEIQIDVYTPFYSKLGISCEDLLSTAVNLDGFMVPTPEALVKLKMVAYQGRKGSDKGRKDLVDIVSLMCLSNIKLSIISPEVISLISLQTEIPELDLNPHQYSKHKKLWKSY